MGIPYRVKSTNTTTRASHRALFRIFAEKRLR
jgi:hypothetical protein